MIGIAAEDGPGAAAMIDAGPVAPPMSDVLGGLRALENLAPTVDTDGAEAMKMTSSEVRLVTTTEHTMDKAHVATPRPAPLHPPGPCPKVKRVSPDPTARLKISTQPPAPTNSLQDDLHPAPNLDPCPGHALAPGPGLDASLEAIDCLSPPKPC